MPVLGIDVGTQSLKAIILDDDFDVLGSGRVAYQPAFPAPDRAEQDPRLWLEALGPAIAAALAEARLAPAAIRAMAVCGQLDGCVPTGKGGVPLAPAMIWMDRRAAARIAGLDAGIVRDRCGLVLDATHMGAKVAWLQSNFPAAAEIATWHQPVSFIVEALTGRRVMSRSLASTTMLCDLGADGWDDVLLDLFEIDGSLLPAVAADCDRAGALSAAGSALTGLPVGLTVAVGTGDDFANVIGAGIGRPGTVAVSLGTAETVAGLSDRATIDHDLLVETHMFPGGGFHLGNPGWLSGGAVRWAAQLLSVDDATLMELASGAAAGCDGLVFIPALTGAMAPKWIAEARGSFIGLTPRHGRAELARAVLEGTAFAMRDVIDRLDALGVPTARIRLMGGGARSGLWGQIRADLTQRPVERLTETDASATGAALMAAVSAGIAPGIAAASEALPVGLETLDPSSAYRAAYEDAYGAYRAAFAALEPTWSSGGISTLRPSAADR